MLISHLIFIFCYQTQMLSVYSKNNGIGLTVLILLEGSVFIYTHTYRHWIYTILIMNFIWVYKMSKRIIWELLVLTKQHEYNTNARISLYCNTHEWEVWVYLWEWTPVWWSWWRHCCWPPWWGRSYCWAALHWKVWVRSYWAASAAWWSSLLYTHTRTHICKNTQTHTHKHTINAGQITFIFYNF